MGFQARQFLCPLIGRQTYTQKVLTYSPIAYWPLNEVSGVTAICQVNVAQNGTYARDVSVMGTETGIGDGNTAPTFDGTQDQVTLTTATLNAAFTPNLYSAGIWVRMSGVGVWTDGTTRAALNFRTNFNNQSLLFKNSGNNQMRTQHKGAATSSYTLSGGLNFTDWRCLIQTVNVAANRHYMYIAGIPTLSGDALVAWVGALAVAYIGNAHGAANWWDGGLAHAFIINSELTQAQVTDLSTL